MLHFILLIALRFIFVEAQDNGRCKDLVLDWDTYQGVLSKDEKICVYSNVRFAGPPTGEFRFQKPRDPSKSDPKPPAGPLSCLQVDYGMNTCIPAPSPFDGGAKSNSNDDDCPYTKPAATHREDCLFLDIYAPLSVINGKEKVPVVVWIYGGAYLFGSKDEFDLSKLPLYSGQGVLEEAEKGSAIFVAGNYRVSIYGWLAGSDFKKSGGVPNVGLYDQRKTLQFVQDNIHLLNGDKSKVSAWGESAGGGSIVHHLTAVNGEQDPLFSKAVLQSPAWQWGWDQQGVIDATYKKFAGFAKCPGGELDCLKNASTKDLDTASQTLFQSSTGCDGIFPVGPSVDGVWVKTLPAVALKKGLFWKKMDSLIISHVQTEVAEDSGFMPYPVRQDPSDANFLKFVHAYMPQSNLDATRAKIVQQYDRRKFRDQKARTSHVIRDSSFTCNTRQLFNAYNGIGVKNWAIYYGFLGLFGKAIHAADLIPTFVNHDTDVQALLAKCETKISTEITTRIAGDYIHNKLAPAYQAYLISHAIHGDPNGDESANTTDEALYWPPAVTHTADQSNKLWSVLKVKNWQPFGNPFRIGSDSVNTRINCDFWDDIAEEIMEKYPGPDGVSSNMTTSTTLGEAPSNMTSSEVGISNSTIGAGPSADDESSVSETEETEPSDDPSEEPSAVPSQPATS